MRVKKILFNIFKGIMVFGQSTAVFGSFLLAYMHFCLALEAVGMSAISYFIGSVVIFAIGLSLMSLGGFFALIGGIKYYADLSQYIKD